MRLLGYVVLTCVASTSWTFHMPEERQSRSAASDVDSETTGGMDGRRSSAVARVSHRSPPAYCGLYCVYAASQIFETAVDFDDILHPQYLTGDVGSSANDLLNVLTAVGLHGSLHRFMTLQDLWLSDQPVILHTRPPGVGPGNSHWVLFLGFEGNAVRLYDPPYDEGTVSVADLLSVWDGTAIVVAKEKSYVRALSLGVPVSLSTITLIVLAAVLVDLCSEKCRSWRKVAVPAMILSCVVHCTLPAGFLQSAQAIGGVQACFFHSDIPAVDYATVARMLRDGECCLVDARPEIAFNRFHLPGAINVPVDSGYLQLERLVRSVRRSKSVVVYCQSESCEWAERVGSQFVMRGVQNVFVYEGGVNEWRLRTGAGE